MPRQNGKNGILEVVELFKIVVLGRKVLHTAHEVKTARKAFLRLKSFFENERKYPELAALVQDIRQTNGQEAIVLTNGGSVEFVARSRGSGRGFTVDDLVLDEAQELSDEQLEALLPTTSAAPSGDPQIIMTGTPPPPHADGAPFKRMRASGVEGKDKRLSWHEWSPERVPDPSDRDGLLEAAAETNPALGLRLQMQVVEDELAQMSFAGFMRERCGAWDSDALGGVIDFPRWLGLAIPAEGAPSDGARAYAVKFSADGERVGVAVGVQVEGAPCHVEALGVRPASDGVAGLVAWLAERARSAAVILVDGKAGAGDMVASLLAAGVPKRRVRLVSTDEAITAHAGFLRAINEGDLTHLAQPGLDSQVRVAGKRKIGNAGGWGWQSVTPGADVTALDAVTLARHGAATAKKRTSDDGSVVIL
ncbi:ATP-binding protein [Georgenia thermotolerans]|uniref:ATP-binding protein n=1 Tax=Georgenia thermotolerans TaxID=527326 RepID=UPI001D0045B2|nr:ATP-binding protein [Georgenia thermotolerans]